MVINSTTPLVSSDISQLNSSKKTAASSKEAAHYSGESKVIDQSQQISSISKNNNVRAQEASEVEAVELTKFDLDDRIIRLNDSLKISQSYLKFERDEDAEKMVVFIKNGDTDEVIRQVPSEEFLAISKNIQKYLEQVNRASSTQPSATGMITNEIA